MATHGCWFRVGVGLEAIPFGGCPPADEQEERGKGGAAGRSPNAALSLLALIEDAPGKKVQLPVEELRAAGTARNLDLKGLRKMELLTVLRRWDLFERRRRDLVARGAAALAGAELLGPKALGKLPVPQLRMLALERDLVTTGSKADVSRHVAQWNAAERKRRAEAEAGSSKEEETAGSALQEKRDRRRQAPGVSRGTLEEVEAEDQRKVEHIKAQQTDLKRKRKVQDAEFQAWLAPRLEKRARGDTTSDEIIREATMLGVEWGKKRTWEEQGR
jgi:hypothetical protein